MRILFLILAYKVIVATVLPFIPSSYWWIRVLEFPRYQLVLIALAALIFLLIHRHLDLHTKIVSGLLVIAVVYQAALIFPYTFLSGKQVKDTARWKDENTISLVIANVLMDNKNSTGFLDLIQKYKPDVILACETNKWWIDKLSVLEQDYQFSVRVPLENTYGMVLFSKLKLLRREIKCLVENDIPSIHVQIELLSGKKVEARFLHPRPPVPNESKDSKERDAELLIVGKEVSKLKTAVIVAGDLNDVAWSETTTLFREISQLLDPRIGRGFYNTFHANYFFLRWPLDYIFHSNHFKLVELQRLPDIDSDHYPVYIKLSYEPEAEKEQEKPSADGEEKKEAEEKIEEGQGN